MQSNKSVLSSINNKGTNSNINKNLNSGKNSNTSYASNINTSVKPKVNLDNLANYTNDSFESLAFSKMDKSHLDSKKDSRISNMNANSKKDNKTTPTANINKFNN